MLDFVKITKQHKNGTTMIFPTFIVRKSNDLMIRGSDFYAIWVEDQKLWSTDEYVAVQLIDRELDEYYEKNKDFLGENVVVKHMWDASSGMIDDWHKYCQRQQRDSYHMLDEKLIFSNMELKKEDYASKRLPYGLEQGNIECYEHLMNVLYSPEERHKLEWAMGSIIAGDSTKIQKFVVLYGSFGTGKSTVLKIMEKLFEGYYSVFDAKALGSSNNSFALEAFRTNPLVGIQHDGDLSRIEDNTRLNSLVSHELMTVNEKFKSTYANRFKTFLFMGTNKPVRITDSKSGLIRRLIDVTPSGNKVSQKEYDTLMQGINFELGAIAFHCREVYLSNKNYYDNYIPTSMMSATNDFYGFMLDTYHIFKKEDGVALKTAWELYNVYCNEAKVANPMPQRIFKEELKSYFREFNERFSTSDGSRVRSYYSGFRTEKFKKNDISNKYTDEQKFMDFKEQESWFDKNCSNYISQLATDNGYPKEKWDKCTTKLMDIDTSKLHYVRLPLQHIVIDFDIKDENGNKSLEKNIEAASKFPETYAELSKSGQGIHLHYIYSGDVTELSNIYDKDIEVKVFKGNASLRRMLTLCNALAIKTISSGLPLLKKGVKTMLNPNTIKDELELRAKINKALNKEVHAYTKPNIDFIHHILEEAYNSGLHYDVSNMRQKIFIFAMSSTNNADYCMKKVQDMKFKSDEESIPIASDNKELIVYDVEVFPNLLLINWKIIGKNVPVVRMINPTPEEVAELVKFNLIGFNNRRYDNHIIYARLLGWSNIDIFNLSQNLIVDGGNSHFFAEAFNLSYTDIYDYCALKQSLKKWEIQLGLHHQELGLQWDQPVPEEKWEEVAAYCDNDVLATEAVWFATQADFNARKIQCKLIESIHGITNMTVNDTTNTLSKRLIFGNERNPQQCFNYRDLSKPVPWFEYDRYRKSFGDDYVFRIFDQDGLPTYEVYKENDILPEGWSILPFFPKYRFEWGKSYWIYDKSNIDIPINALKEDEDYTILGEGGKVFAKPGMYSNVWDGDIASQHPHSAIFEVAFGAMYTKRFEDLVKARVHIKHKDFEAAGKMFNGALKPFLNDEQAPALAQALKIIINSIYGLTSAKFANEFKDPRNKDNIVAKRGCLFMSLLKEQVEEQGYRVAHIKTDSIKIPDADEYIKNFVIKFGKEFGYSFETEAEFDRFCIVNDAVYVAYEKESGWTATGTQFQIPYVFKTLFSKENIEFLDLCQAKSVKSAIYLDMNEYLPENEHNYIFIGKTGLFCPIKPGCNGGRLVRSAEGKNGIKYDSVTGTKDYRWLESEVVEKENRKSDIDISYYDKLVDEAIAEISKYGDFHWFVTGEVSDVPWYDDDNDIFNKR